MSRGGKRPGAGRPRGTGPRRVPVSVRITEEAAAHLAEIAGSATVGVQAVVAGWAALPEDERRAMALPGVVHG